VLSLKKKKKKQVIEPHVSEMPLSIPRFLAKSREQWKKAETGTSL
jgi:hypothetical protein